MNLSRAQLSDYVNSLNEISAQAQKTFSDELWSVYNATGRDIDMLHDAINMLAPSIADQYGAVASTISADLWEKIYKADTGLSADAVIDTTDTSHLFGASSGYAFRDGRSTDARVAIAHVAGTMGRAVRNHARTTMRSNTDRYGGRYARVPTGDKTCAFCLMLASRGFIYLSEDSAGKFDQYHDNCFVGDTNVAGPDILRTIRRHYEGPLVNICTATGRELSVTPNHPILTDKGWVEAGLLDIGSRLACRSDCDSHVCGVPDKKHGNIHIEDIFSSSRVLYASRFGIMPRTTEYLDSDGRTEEIDVVDTDGFFVDKRKTALRSKRVEPRFACGHFLDPGGGFPLNRMRTCDLCLDCLMASSHGVMSGCDLRHTAFRCHRMGTDYTCFASAPTFNPGFINPSRYSSSGNTDPDGNGVNGFSGYESLDDSIWARNLVAFGLDAGCFNDFVTSAPVYSGARGNIPDGLAGSISFDDIVSYGVSEFCGHVYNLTTDGNWYLANGIIAHNCDCEVVASFDTDNSAIEGYSPDEYYKMYRDARAEAGSGNTNAILSKMREMYGLK